MVETSRSDIATLGKLVTLRPVPDEATWSVTTLGSDGVPGPADSVLWAVLRYSKTDGAAIARTLEAGATLPPASTDEPPAWLREAVDLTRFRHGAAYVFPKPVSAAPFASDLYVDGFAMLLPDGRVLIRFGSR